MARKKSKIELKNLIEKVIRSIKDDFVIDEVLLFGSYAKGSANQDSDIDLAVISPDLSYKSIYNNVRCIKEKTKLMEPYLQLFAFPSNMFYRETFIDPGFIQEIKRTGKKVYTKESGVNFSTL